MTDKTEKELYLLFEDHNSNSKEQLEPDTIYALVQGIKDIISDNSSIKQIEKFMTTFNQKVRTKPTMPPPKECLFRISLITEETFELAEACGSEVLSQYGLDLYKLSEKIRLLVEAKRESLIPNLVAALDAFKDLEYVTYGGEVTFGFQDKSSEAFLEVHESNMSKMCINAEELENTLLKYEAEGIKVEGEGTKDDNGYLVLRASDRKVLKSINYRPANSSKFIEVLDEAPTETLEDGV